MLRAEEAIPGGDGVDVDLLRFSGFALVVEDDRQVVHDRQRVAIIRAGDALIGGEDEPELLLRGGELPLLGQHRRQAVGGVQGVGIFQAEHALPGVEHGFVLLLSRGIFALIVQVDPELVADVQGLRIFRAELLRNDLQRSAAACLGAGKIALIVNHLRQIKLHAGPFQRIALPIRQCLGILEMLQRIGIGDSRLGRVSGELKRLDRIGGARRGCGAGIVRRLHRQAFGFGVILLDKRRVGSVVGARIGRLSKLAGKFRELLAQHLFVHAEFLRQRRIRAVFQRGRIVLGAVARAGLLRREIQQSLASLATSCVLASTCAADWCWLFKAHSPRPTHMTSKIVAAIAQRFTPRRRRFRSSRISKLRDSRASRLERE